MNLVAKEAVLVGERDPVLVLSETAGAAEQLAGDSLVVAPADVAGTAEQLERALRMPPRTGGRTSAGSASPSATRTSAGGSTGSSATWPRSGGASSRPRAACGTRCAAVETVEST